MTNYPGMTEAELRRLYVDERKGTPQIARLFGVTPPVVARRLRAAGIPVRPVGRIVGVPHGKMDPAMTKARAAWKRIPLPDAEELRRLYEVEGLTLEKIGARFGTNGVTIANRFKEYGIRRRTFSEAARLSMGPTSRLHGQKPYRTARELTFIAEGRARVCERCGGTTRIMVHHGDRNPLNQERSNREVLCTPCHMRHHASERRLAKR